MGSRSASTPKQSGEPAWKQDLERALALKAERKFVEAVHILQQVLHHHTFEALCREKGRIQLELARIYAQLKDNKHAFELYYEALNCALEHEEYDAAFGIYAQIGSIHQGIWQFKKAIDTYQQAHHLALRLGKVDKIIEFELNIGNTLNWDDQLEEAEQYLRRVLDKEKLIRDENIRQRAHGSYAILLRKLKRYDEAEKYFQVAIKLSQSLSDIMQMDMKKSYGIMQYELGNIDLAEKLLLESIEIAERDIRDATKAVIYESLAILYRDKNDFEKALEYTNKFYKTKISNLEVGYSEENNLLQAKMGLEEARREKRFAEEAMQMKSMFIASISHEIRTPMNIILGTTGLMLNDQPKPEHVKYLQVLQRSSENLLGIINDILDLSKIEAGKFEIEPEPAELPELLGNVYAIFRQSAADKGITLSYDIDPKLDFAFYTDPLRFSQVLTNLIGNAIKFTTQGGVHTTAILKPKGILELSVHDTGIGIPKDKLPSVFEHYEQVKNQNRRTYKGTGLGLSISKKLVEMMNGSISVKSRVNEGTTFTIRLPVEKAVIEKRAGSLLAPQDAGFLDGRTILVVDDTPENRFISTETLRFFHPGVICAEAENGKHALEVLQQTDADLVIMDLDMPVMNGFEALAAIRRDKKLKHLKVVATTASLVANNEKEFLELGFNGFLPKPFAPEKFLDTLREQLT